MLTTATQPQHAEPGYNCIHADHCITAQGAEPRQTGRRAEPQHNHTAYWTWHNCPGVLSPSITAWHDHGITALASWPQHLEPRANCLGISVTAPHAMAGIQEPGQIIQFCNIMVLMAACHGSIQDLGKIILFWQVMVVPG